MAQASATAKCVCPISRRRRLQKSPSESQSLVRPDRNVGARAPINALCSKQGDGYPPHAALMPQLVCCALHRIPHARRSTRRRHPAEKPSSSESVDRVDAVRPSLIGKRACRILPETGGGDALVRASEKATRQVELWIRCRSSCDALVADGAGQTAISAADRIESRNWAWEGAKRRAWRAYSHTAPRAYTFFHTAASASASYRSIVCFG